MGRALRRALIATLALATVAPLPLTAPAPDARAAQAMSGREVQRLLLLADEAMESARNLLARRETRQARSRLEEAEHHYRRILDANPAQKDAAVGLSGVLFLTRRYDDGVQLLRPFRERLPDDHDVAHELGLHLYRAGQQATAVPILQEIAEDEGRFDASWLLAVHFYRQAEWTTGLAHAERYAAARPEDTRALALLGTYYLKTEAYAKAVDALDRYLATHPDNLAARINRANALFRKGDLKPAAAAYEGLLAKHPDRMRLVYNLAAVRIKQDRCDDALPLLERFIANEERDASARYFRADCLLKLRRYGEAQRAFEEAKVDSSSNPWIYHGLSRIALAEGRTAEAVGHARRASELAPEDWEIVTWLGTLLRRTGAAGEALTWHDRAAELEPSAAPIYVERGRDLWALSRPADALAAFEQARRLAPTDPAASRGAAAALTALALADREAGGDEAARARLDDALALDAAYEPARVNRALIALSAGELAAAKAALQGSPAADPGPDHAALTAFIALREGDIEAATAAAARAEGARLTSVLAEVRGHLAAAKDEWGDAARELDSAYSQAPRRDLDRARTFASLQAGLQRLARGDGAGARAALQRASRRTQLLGTDDRATLEFANAALQVVTSADPLRSAQGLLSLLRSPRYRGKRWAFARDAGHAYAAYAYLRAHNPDKALETLAKVDRRAALGAAVGAMRTHAQDLKARRAFTRKDWAGAAAIWQRLVDAHPDDIATRSNLAAARFNQGQLDEAARAWRALVDAPQAPPEVLFNLGNAADRQGDQRAAWRYFKRYVATGAPGAGATRERIEAKERVFGLAVDGGGT